jgi:iron complex outermembrane recepter protein
MFRRTKVCSALALAFGGGLLIPAAPVFAQQLERVEITGSSIKRIDAETALPVQVVTREEIARSGVTSTEQLLASISAVSSSGSLNNASGAGLSTYGFSSISLRGLGEDRTLVLVNGRRIAPFAGGNGAGVNINAIPLAAIERVEVLKDGASAVYGSDAIGGVVNFILKKDYQGLELGATYGQPTRSGGGKSTRATIVGGFGNLDRDRFNVTASASFEKETTLFGKDREFAKTGFIQPFLDRPATGQGNIEGGYNPSNGTTPYNPTQKPATPTTPFVPGEDTFGFTPGRQVGFGNSPGAGYGNPLAATNTCGTVNMVVDPGGPTSKGAPYCSFDSAPFANLLPKRDLTTLSLNGEFKVNDAVHFFGDALYSKSVVTQTIQPSPIRRSFLVTDEQFATSGVNPVLLIRPTNPNYSIAANYLAALAAQDPITLDADGNPVHNGPAYAALAGQPLAVTARVFDFGPRTQKDTSTQERLVAGIRGSVLNQDYEVALSTNRNKLEGTVTDGYFSQVGFSRVVNDLTNDYNPWSLTQSQGFNDALAAANVKYIGPTLNAKSTGNAIDGKITGDVMQLPAGTLQYAAGLQYRKEKLDLDPAPALLTGDIAGLGGATKPLSRDRKITSAYGELNAPIIKNLEGNVAVRSDRYDDVGNTSNYKASFRWQPVKEVLLRGSSGSGFRAPTLNDLWAPQVLGSTEQFTDPATGESGLQVNSLTGGNPTLKPEKSRQQTIGLVLQPIDSLSVAIDYFNINVTNLIALPSTQEVVSRFRAGDPAFANLVTLAGNDVDSIVQVLQNVGSLKTKGFDVEANYRQNVGPGRLNLNLSGTYTQTFDVTSPGGVLVHEVGRIVDDNGNPVIGTNAQSGTGGVVLRWKHVLSGTWSQGPWDFTLAQNFIKGYRDANNDDDGITPHRVPSYSLYDAQVAFKGIKNLTLALGVKNLFDKDPPLYVQTSNQFQNGYDPSLYDPRARFVYFTASYKFF